MDPQKNDMVPPAEEKSAFSKTASSPSRQIKDPSPIYATIDELNKLGKSENVKTEVVVAATAKKPVNLEDLYAKVNKPPKEKPQAPQPSTCSPPVPRRNRKNHQRSNPLLHLLGPRGKSRTREPNSNPTTTTNSIRSRRSGKEP
jgi:hypothetical protein